MSETEIVPVQEPARRFITTMSDNPVMDTASFEHMARIAKTMAMSGMMHRTLTWGKNENGQDAPLPYEIVAARAFLIVEQAVRWNQSPMAVMQAASFVHGRLMWEGKLVAAILEDVFGIKLDYKFGVWDVKLGKVIISTDGEEPGETDLLGVRVSERGGDASRYIEGYVGSWKTTGNNSPWKQGAMKRQLRYRGAREWSRAFRSSAILGIVTDDEPIEQIDAAPQPVLKGRGGKLAEKLAAPQEATGGFSAEHAASELGGQDAQEAAGAAKGTETPVEGENAAPGPETGEAAASDAKDEPKTDETGSAGDDTGKAMTENTGDPDLTVAIDREKLAAEIKKAEDEKAGENAKEKEPSPLQKYFDIIGTEKDFKGVKAAVVALTRDDDYKALERGDQNAVNRKIWALILKATPGQNIHLSEPTAFRFWIETLDSPDEARAGLRTLKTSPIYMALPEASQTNFMGIFDSRMAELERK